MILRQYLCTSSACGQLPIDHHSSLWSPSKPQPLRVCLPIACRPWQVCRPGNRPDGRGRWRGWSRGGSRQGSGEPCTCAGADAGELQVCKSGFTNWNSDHHARTPAAAVLAIGPLVALRPQQASLFPPLTAHNFVHDLKLETTIENWFFAGTERAGGCTGGGVGKGTRCRAARCAAGRSTGRCRSMQPPPLPCRSTSRSTPPPQVRGQTRRLVVECFW